MLTYKELQNNESIRTYIAAADASLGALGYTEHNFGHVTKVADCAKYILENLSYCEHDVELGQIAALLHDIGNMVNRKDHAQSGAILAFQILCNFGFSASDIALVVSAIGNHDETEGMPINAIAAALILADKSDVRRSRVRSDADFDIHDRVNYSVTESHLSINENKDTITLHLKIDSQYSSVMEYFEIFLERMLMCKKAASALGLHFRLIMNDQHMI